MPASSRLFIGFTLCLALCGFPGCREPVHSKSQSPSEMTDTTGKPKFGSFNLQKRHGLGGWQGQSGPSQQELLEQMGKTQGPALEKQTRTGEAH